MPHRVPRCEASSRPPRRFAPPAFTLVEILIVVVILGILAAIVIPQFSRAASEAQSTTTISELQKVRRHIEVFRTRNSGVLPVVAEGDGTWGEIVGFSSEYLRSAPVNAWVGGPNARIIRFGDTPDAGFQLDYGWIFDPLTGRVWAGGFNADDVPFARE